MDEPQKYALAKKAGHKKSHLVWFQFYEISRGGKTTERELRQVVVKSWEERRMGCTATWYEVFFGKPLGDREKPLLQWK